MSSSQVIGTDGLAVMSQVAGDVEEEYNKYGEYDKEDDSEKEEEEDDDDEEEQQQQQPDADDDDDDEEAGQVVVTDSVNSVAAMASQVVVNPNFVQTETLSGAALTHAQQQNAYMYLDQNRSSAQKKRKRTEEASASASASAPAPAPVLGRNGAASSASPTNGVSFESTNTMTILAMIT